MVVERLLVISELRCLSAVKSYWRSASSSSSSMTRVGPTLRRKAIAWGKIDPASRFGPTYNSDFDSIVGSFKTCCRLPGKYAAISVNRGVEVLCEGFGQSLDLFGFRWPLSTTAVEIRRGARRYRATQQRYLRIGRIGLNGECVE